MEAVWSSNLRPLERLVAAVYFDHARNSDCAWLTIARLQERTGLSRPTAIDMRRALVDGGWLVTIDQATSRRAAIYRLTIPEVKDGYPNEASGGKGRLPPEVKDGASGGKGRLPNLSTYPKTNPTPSGRGDNCTH